MAIQLLITNEDLQVVGDLLSNWTELEAGLKFNEPGSGTVTMPAHPYVMAQLQTGQRLLVLRDEQVWMSGPMEIPEDYKWGLDEGAPGVGEVMIQFTDDLARPAGYKTWPHPGVAWEDGQDGKYSVASGNAETIIRTLIDLNCGPGALTARQIPHLILGSAAGVGTTTTVSTRLEPLLEVCRRVAQDGGGLGFRVRQDETDLVFEVYAPTDRTKTARFSEGLGNLRGVTYKRSAPTVTHALVQGSEVESPAVRAYVEVADTAAASSYWRVEELVDGGADNDGNGELTQEGSGALAEGAAPVELATVTADIPDRPGRPGLIAGRDFGLGDRVTVELPTGVELAEVVRSMTLHATPDGGEQVTTVIGSPDATTDPKIVRLVRNLGRRLGRQEAR